MAGNDRSDPAAWDVLEQGPTGQGRLATLGRSRAVRLVTSVLVGAAVLGWLFLGPGVPGQSSSPAPADEPVAAGEVADEPVGPVPSRERGEGECEKADGASKADALDRDGAAGGDVRSRALAASLYRFSRDPSPTTQVPWARDIAITAPGAWVVVPRSRAVTRNAWTTVSGRTGDYLLHDLAASEGRYRVDDTVHLDCRSRPRVARDRPVDASWVSVQARASVGCSAWWAVDVFLDERDRVARVTVTTR